MSVFSGSLDTNVVLRLLLKDIPDQHLAVTTLIQGASRQFVVADTAVVEVVFVLEREYGFTRAQIAEIVGGLVTLAEINCNRILVEKALPIFMKHSGLSFEDCCLAVYAELNDAKPLWTFDQKLANQVPGAKLLA